MTPREAEGVIVGKLRPLLMEHGFSRRMTAWYRHDRQFLQMIEVQVGQEAITVRLGAMYRRLNRATHPTLYECHISIGLGSIVRPGIDWRTLRAYRDWIWLGDSRIQEFVKTIREIAVPVLDQWRSEESIRQFLKTPLGLRADVHQELTTHLARHKRGEGSPPVEGNA